MKLFRKTLVAAATFAALAPSPLLACAACGSANPYTNASPLTNGMNLGILTLFGVILTVLACFALFFVHIARGEKAQIESENNSNPPPQNPPKV